MHLGARIRHLPALLLVAAASACGAPANAPDAGRAVLVIAHRGASGYLPEHTLAAYALAYGMGADYLEPDLVMTRDGVPIARHDLHLESTTDVAERFPGRARPDGHYYAADFHLEEIRALEARAARARRYARDAAGFAVPSFEEVLRLVGELDRLTGCRVGLYPELKAPSFHAAEGLPLEERVLELLAAHGYRSAEDPVVLQSFEPESLERLRFALGATLRLAQLVPGGASGEALLDDEGLRRVARYADVLAPSKRLLVDRSGGTRSGVALLRRARAAGLAVHAWTLRADEVPPAFDSFEDELRALAALGVDGLFTDHPDRTAALLESLGRRTPRRCPRPNSR